MPAPASESPRQRPDDFDQIFRQYYEPLTRQVARMVDCDHVAEELVQDVFFRMWNSHGELEVRGDYISYLRRAARNRALDWIRRRTLHRAWEQTAALEVELPSSFDHPFAHASGDDEIARVRQVLDACLRDMPERRRQVCDLRWRHELGPTAIALKLGISVKTVEAHLTLGTKELRAQFFASQAA